MCYSHVKVLRRKKFLLLEMMGAGAPHPPVPLNLLPISMALIAELIKRISKVQEKNI